MNSIETPEGLMRLIAKMPEDDRSIYFYTQVGKEQPLNPGVQVRPNPDCDPSASEITPARGQSGAQNV